MDNNDVENLFLQISGNDVDLCKELIMIFKCLINNLMYNRSPIIHIYGHSFNNKLLFLYIIEILYKKEQYTYLNELLLYNSYSSWYKDSLKICFINNFHPMYFNMIQTNVVTLTQDNIFVGNTYKTGVVCKPLLKFIIISNYLPNVFSKYFNDLTTHINFDITEIDNIQFEKMYNTIQNNTDKIIQFIGNY